MTETITAPGLADAISALITDSNLAQSLTEGLGDALVVGQVVKHVTAAIDAAETGDEAAWQHELDSDLKAAEEALAVAQDKIAGLKAPLKPPSRRSGPPSTTRPRRTNSSKPARPQRQPR